MKTVVKKISGSFKNPIQKMVHKSSWKSLSPVMIRLYKKILVSFKVFSSWISELQFPFSVVV
jgi:hypothetical protein